MYATAEVSPPPSRAADLPVYFPAFDALRLILASTVVIGHSRVPIWPQAGNFSVMVFFALSGWLIGGILMRTDPADLPRFFYNRATRIWIPYAIAVAVFYTASTLRDPITWRWAEFLAYDVTFTHNWWTFRPTLEEARALMPLHGTGNHFWSISVEEQFYLFAPLLILFMPIGRSTAIWVAASIALIAGESLFAPVSLGVAAAVAQAHFGDWHRSVAGRIALILVLVVSACFLTSSYAYARAPVAICIVLLLAVPGPKSAILRVAGGISYPLYLNHWIGLTSVSIAFRHFGWDTAYGSALVGFAVALGIGWLHYTLIDARVLRSRGRYYTPAKGQAFQVAAYCLFAAGMALGITRWVI